MNILEKAEKYAEGKANEAITKAIAQAYIDGYRDGYKDRENEIPMSHSGNETEYIDLGLPSGTLWATDYEKSDGERLYLSYGQTKGLKLPTEEQWKELFEQCKYVHHEESGWLSKIEFAGPNGNILTIEATGKILVSEIEDSYNVHFWIEQDGDDGENNEYDAATADYSRIWTESGHYYYGVKHWVAKVFSGYKLPIRLVR